MNENLDLCLILKNCPKGTKLYCTFLGDVLFSKIEDNKIIIHTSYTVYSFYSDGKFTCDGECVLFPSKEQRDWSMFERFWDKPKIERFDPKTLHPWDKILVRKIHSPYNISPWSCENFSYIHPNTPQLVNGIVSRYEICIPYNEETKHLVGTTEDCPEYYKWWEE